MSPSTGFPPVENCRGTRPSQAANCRPFLNSFASPTLATTALAVTGPTPQTATMRCMAALSRTWALMRRS